MTCKYMSLLRQSCTANVRSKVLFSIGRCFRKQAYSRGLHGSVTAVPLSRSVMSDDNNTTWPKVVLFGDSLTQFGYSKDGCWASLVSDYVIRKCDVINRGFSGYNTRWCKLIFPNILTPAVAKETILLTIFLGANDSVDDMLNKKQHVPLAEFKENMKQMVEYAQSVGLSREKIIVISPPACDEAMWEADCKLNGRAFGKFNKPTHDYADACVEVAKEMGTKYVDLYSEMMKDPNYSSMLNDGLHLSTKGSELLFSMLMPILEKHTQSLPFLYPYWQDIDNDNPHAVLDKYV